MANTSAQTKTKFKFKVLGSFLLSEEKKTSILTKIETLTDEQMKSITEVIDQAELEAKPLVSAGFSSEKGADLFARLKQIDKQLKKNVRKQEEKEDRADEQKELGASLSELDGITQK